MPTLETLFGQGQAGLTVYTPDCTQSQLWGNLDHFIYARTGFQVIHRQWITHNYNTAMAFYNDDGRDIPYKDPDEAYYHYETIPTDQIQYGHLMVRLLLSGSCLLTIWQGENVIETLLDVKGKTHPAEAPPDSVRGRFWCDTAVGNLMHTSDNIAEARRELATVNLSHLLGETLSPKLLIPPRPTPTYSISHCAISVVCDVVYRMIIATFSTRTARVHLPVSGIARETVQQLTHFLKITAKSTSINQISDFIYAYLNGDLVAVTNMMTQLPTTSWERLVIQCGAVTRDKWNA